MDKLSASVSYLPTSNGALILNDRRQMVPSRSFPSGKDSTSAVIVWLCLFDITDNCIIFLIVFVGFLLSGNFVMTGNRAGVQNQVFLFDHVGVFCNKRCTFVHSDRKFLKNFSYYTKTTSIHKRPKRFKAK